MFPRAHTACYAENQCSEKNTTGDIPHSNQTIGFHSRVVQRQAPHRHLPQPLCLETYQMQYSSAPIPLRTVHMNDVSTRCTCNTGESFMDRKLTMIGMIFNSIALAIGGSFSDTSKPTIHQVPPNREKELCGTPQLHLTGRDDSYW